MDFSSLPEVQALRFANTHTARTCFRGNAMALVAAVTRGLFFCRFVKEVVPAFFFGQDIALVI